MKPRICRTAPRDGMCALLVVLLLSSCAGPERAPRQPIPGVDVPHPKGTNPHDIVGGAGALAFLGSFPEEVAATVKAAPGTIVVLPALTLNSATDENHVNGLGEHLATQTVLRLEKAGVQALAGSDLVLAMHRKDLSLKYYDSTADAAEIARRLEASYVVTGVVRRRVAESLKRDELLEIDWVCSKVVDGVKLVRYRPEPMAGGSLVERLARYYRQGSDWDHAVRHENLDPPAAD